MPNGKILSLIAALAVLAAWTQTAPAQEAPERIKAPAAVEKPGELAPPQEPLRKAEDKGTGQTEEEEKPPPAGGLDRMWILLLPLGAVALMVLWTGRGRRKEQQRRREMLATLKKGDKITTIGGVVGTVMEVRDDEVTVKVDESGNVRMKFARWAIRGIGDLAKAESPAAAARQQQQSEGK
jgi:preprotein translocase subunit YajC